MYQEVYVTSFYFAKGNTSRSFPRRIETPTGEQISFVEEGLRCVVKKGQELLEIFTMSDGHQQYRLGHEQACNVWRLISPHTL